MWSGFSPAAAVAVDRPIGLPYDPTKGMPIPALLVNEHEAMAVLPVRALMELVPDPLASETPKRVAEDERLAEYGELRKEVQRLVEGAKKKNAIDFGTYIAQGLRHERPWILPPITLWHRELLETVNLGMGLHLLLLPFGDFFIAIDGETQRIAWQNALRQVTHAGDYPVKVVIHHGKPREDARQGFYDLNTKEVKPNSALSISMDTLDPATRITRAIMDESPVLAGAVNLRRRQLRKGDTEKVTISALRTGVVTTLLGVSGLQTGAKSISLPPGIDFDEVKAAAIATWTDILAQFDEEFAPERRRDLLISAPPILAGIGVLAHHTMPDGLRRDDVEPMSIDDVLLLLEDVSWSREAPFPWEGIAGKVNVSEKDGSMTFSVGGPKEYGHPVAAALKHPESDAGRKIRGRGPARRAATSRERLFADTAV